MAKKRTIDEMCRKHSYKQLKVTETKTVKIYTSKVSAAEMTGLLMI